MHASAPHGLMEATPGPYAPAPPRRKCSTAALAAPPRGARSKTRAPHTQRLRSAASAPQNMARAHSAAAAPQRTGVAKHVEAIVKRAPHVHVAHQLLRRRLREALLQLRRRRAVSAARAGTCAAGVRTGTRPVLRRIGVRVQPQVCQHQHIADGRVGRRELIQHGARALHRREERDAACRPTAARQRTCAESRERGAVFLLAPAMSVAAAYSRAE